MEIRDNVFVVTGGGNGIGRELVLNLLLQGALVASVDLNQQALEETARLAGAHRQFLSLHVTNITDKESVEKLPDEIIAKHGKLDGLINNAGIIQPFVNFMELDNKTIEQVFQVNFFGAMNLTKAFLPYLLNRPKAHLVNVSSMGGFFPFPGQTIYGASKAALKLFTEGLYAELLGSNVKVTIVLPGGISTNITANSGVKMAAHVDENKTPIQLTSPPLAALKIIKAMKKNKYKVLIGNDAKLMNILYKFSPRKSIRLVSRLMKKFLSGN